MRDEDIYKRTRLFSGKKYYIFAHTGTKKGADRQANRLRKNGYKARVVEFPSVYLVYSRPEAPFWGDLFLKKRK